MVEIVISVAAKIAEYLVAPVGRPFRYLWNYKTNLENLKNEVEKLEAKRDTVQLSIKPGEDPMPDVKLWQERANRIIVEIPKVVEDNPEQANIQCFKGFSCPNLMKRYQRSKKAAKKLKDVLVLEQEAAPFLREVAYPTIPEQTTLQPSKGYVAFESRKSILKDIIDALRDPDVNIVGIYGMGGIGKTALAREVASEAQQHNLFDKRVFVEVSESQDFQIIQGVIADNLGLHFNEESVPGRANRLRIKIFADNKKPRCANQ
ncbi:hypothetical protein Q3G72_012181 [Acer saccharum]|nr:hypothetical protein Q3G72_012181 [Acer saccharum]